MAPKCMYRTKKQQDRWLKYTLKYFDMQDKYHEKDTWDDICDARMWALIRNNPYYKRRFKRS